MSSMDPGAIFAFLFFGICAAIVATGLVAMHFDQVAVFALRLVDAPVFEEARMVAALLYQHPEQWNRRPAYGMEHPQVGKLHSATHVAGLQITGSVRRLAAELHRAPDHLERGALAPARAHQEAAAPEHAVMSAWILLVGLWLAFMCSPDRWASQHRVRRQDRGVRAASDRLTGLP